MNTYTVTFGKQGFDREVVDFTSKAKAEKFAKKKVEEGKEKVFVDIFNEDGDLIASELIK